MDRKLAGSLHKVLLNTMNCDSRADKKKTLPVTQKLTEMYFNGFGVSPTMPSWQEQQNVICRCLTEMEISPVCDGLGIFSFYSRLEEFHLHHSLAIDAERLFLRVCRGQRRVLGPWGAGTEIILDE